MFVSFMKLAIQLWGQHSTLPILPLTRDARTPCPSTETRSASAPIGAMSLRTTSQHGAWRRHLILNIPEMKKDIVW